MLMTEEKWLSNKSIAYLMSSLKRPSKRKYRLFGCACCRLIWALLNDKRSRSAVQAAESWADGLQDGAQMAIAQQLAERALYEHTTNPNNSAFDARAEALQAANCIAMVNNKVRAGSAVRCVEVAILKKNRRDCNSEREFASRVLCPLFRDIFGNPFRPVTLDPRWLSSTVLDLTRTIYNERVFERLPILADALMDAGCDSDEIIKHCQGPGPHVRGCWVVDLILGKK